MALGVDLSALEQALEVRESTLRTWLTCSGEHGQKLHERFFVGLQLLHLQLDELLAHVKQAEEAVWVWTVCDAKTKHITVLQIGPRSQAMAYSVVHELKARLKTGWVPLFSTDGLKHYFYALTAHFDEWIAAYGQRESVWLILETFFYAQIIKL